MINKIKNFFFRICSFFYFKSNESEHEKRYGQIACKCKINDFVDNVQEKTSNENIVSDNPVEFKQNSVKNTLNNEWVSGHKKTKKLN
jgi:hypothetical protein